MNILFVHQNFPGQYRHLAGHLAAVPGNRVVFITQRVNAALPGVRTLVYKPLRKATEHLHHYLRDTETGVLNAQAVARVGLDLRNSGFIPDVMVGHNGWGEIWYLKDVFPQAPLLGYFEFFYRLSGTDVGFDPSEKQSVDTAPRIRTKNLGNLLGLQAADCGQCPTGWQKSTYPPLYRSKLRVVHEGIDSDLAIPDAQARLTVDAFQHGAGRAFAVRAGDVDEAELVLRVASERGELARRFQTEVRAEDLQAVKKFDGGKVSQPFFILHSAFILSAKAACDGCARGRRR